MSFTASADRVVPHFGFTLNRISVRVINTIAKILSCEPVCIRMPVRKGALMKIRFVLVFAVLLFATTTVFGQNDLQIKKKMSMKIPGMPALPPGMGNPIADRKSTEYIKGGRMRTDMEYDQRKMTGGKQKVTQTTIVQCDKQRRVSFNSKKKSYYSEPMSGVSSSEVKNARSGGYIIMTGVVTDTGERAKLFGYDAKHLKQSYTITPGPNSCQKETLKIEMDGWYVDLPEFSCPIRRKPREFQMDSKCFDEVEYKMKGEVTGFPVKEIKTMTMQGMTMNIEEEAVEILKVPLADSLFEPPVNYKAANTLKEVEDDSDDAAGSFDPTIDPAPTTTTISPTLALPKAGIENPGKVAKRAGVIRVGIVKPSVQLADKNSAESASDVADAVAAVFEERLTKPNVEVVRLTSEAEAKNAECDYVIQATISQKRAGGGLIGMMLSPPKMPKMPDANQQQQSSPATMELLSALSPIVKAKDEFTFDFKLLGIDRSPAFQKAGKVKTSYYGEDALSLPIREASDGILAKFPSR